MKRLLVSFLIIYLLVLACDTVTELEPEKVQIYYKTDVLFCEGTHRVYREGLSEKKNRIGVWKFYHPNSKILSQNEYDELGEIINYKKYDDEGNLKYSEIVEGGLTIETVYYPHGTVESELIERMELKYNDDEEYVIYYQTEKIYFENGGIKELSEFTDWEIETLKVWDEDGNIIIEVEYEDGIIQ